METNIDDLKHIRSMMERSSKFFSLSGLSGVFAGVIATIGAVIMYYILNGSISIVGNKLYDSLGIAVIVIICAGAAGLYFSLRKAKKSGSKFWLPITKQIAIDFAIPMVVGGVFCGLLIYQGCTRMVAASMLIFYGLALINAGSRTYKDIKILGISEIILGILAGISYSMDFYFGHLALEFYTLYMVL